VAPLEDVTAVPSGPLGDTAVVADADEPRSRPRTVNDVANAVDTDLVTTFALMR
jgi:hypothetical protein